MAKSENQGLQIAVIIFAFLTIALSIATFYFFNDGQTQLANSLDHQQKAQENQNLARQLVDENNALHQSIGQPPGTKPADTQKKLEELLAKLAGVNFPANGRTYIAAIDTLKLTLDQKNQLIIDQTKKGQELDAQIKKVEADYKKDVETTVADFKKRNDEYEGLVKTLQAKDAEHIAKVKQLTDELQKKRDELAKAIDDSNKLVQALQKQLDNANKEVAYVKKKEYEGQNWVFERPDATIVSVSPKTQTVNIDVGRKDHLRLNIQFAVFERGETNVYNRKKKGSISVTRFIEDNLAEARIVESDLKNPILQGDVVFTPTWSPGLQERFVLAGDFDVKGDKKPDNDLIRALVEMNGGAVDEDVSIATRYLLLGDAPPDKKSEAYAKYEKRRQRAKELSIKVMGLQEFLEYSGSARTLSQLVSLDNRSKEETRKILQHGVKQELKKQAFAPPEPEGGLRRLDPSSPPRATSDAASGGEGGKKPPLPPRRNTPVQ